MKCGSNQSQSIKEFIMFTFGQSAITKAIINGNDIQSEVALQIQDAQDKIGLQQAIQEFVNDGLAEMPLVCDGYTTITYRNERGAKQEKQQHNNHTMWVISMDMLGYHGHLNSALLGSAMHNWVQTNSVELTKEQCVELAKLYIKSMQDLHILETNIQNITAWVDGKQITVRASVMTSTFKENMADVAEEMRKRVAMTCKPLTHRPVDWTDMRNGIGEGANIPLVKGYKLKGVKVAPKVLSAVNKLQGVQFVAHPAVIAGAYDMRVNKHLHLADKGWFDDKELTEEAFMCYEEAQKYAKGVYHFPVTMDTRGRMYYRGGLLTPQGTDFCKAMWQFAEYKELGEHGFKAVCIHTANVFGCDKLSIADRITWVQQQWDNLCQMETHDDIRKHYAKSDTWQALVASQTIKAIAEHIGAGNPVETFKSNLVCHMDGTCNGLQHMSAITGDRTTAETVNCTASTIKDVPTDIYGVIATQAQEYVSGESLELVKKYARSMAKNPVMVTGYGATRTTIVRNTASFLQKNRESNEHAEAIADAYLNAIRTKAGAVTQLTESLRVVMAQAIAEGTTKVTWKTADGFIASTEYRDVEPFRVRVGVQSARLRGMGKGELDEIKTQGALAPNFIHSIDATHLRMVVNNSQHDLVTVHDSIGCHACDYFDTARTVRETFALVHNDSLHNALEDLCTSLGQPTPKFNKDYSAVEALKSTYIFS